MGNRYLMQDIWAEVSPVMEIGLSDVTNDMARDSGFAKPGRMLKTAKHREGRRA